MDVPTFADDAGKTPVTLAQMTISGAKTDRRPGNISGAVELLAETAIGNGAGIDSSDVFPLLGKFTDFGLPRRRVT